MVATVHRQGLVHRYPSLWNAGGAGGCVDLCLFWEDMEDRVTKRDSGPSCKRLSLRTSGGLRHLQHSGAVWRTILPPLGLEGGAGPSPWSVQPPTQEREITGYA
eukprot:GGOE01034622.1.p3 GENE.GGOE01034622.1~~GGOE01034622.1.p3  ORF type:complete len:104 (-),score=4.02 GGOE01034622.1:529-840(-)